MSLLEDAIREHLELKRTRGADPAEVAQLEREALGPMSREATDVALATPPSAPDELQEDQAERVAVEQAPPPEPAPDPGEAPEPPADPAVAEAAVESLEPAVEAPVDEDPPHGDAVLGETMAFDPLSEEDRDALEPDPSAPPAAGAPAGEEPTQAHPAARPETEADWLEDDPPPAPDPDPLEETPEFLEETPEHDRLWFEQKPPRDFDFDG